MSCCHDCPQLLAERMPDGWKPRATCCMAEIERRDQTLRHEELRSVMREAQGPGNRATRRLNSSNKNRKTR